MVFPVSNGKKWTSPLNSDIQISLGTKYQIKLAIVYFLNNICPKNGVPGLKLKKKKK